MSFSWKSSLLFEKRMGWTRTSILGYVVSLLWLGGCSLTLPSGLQYYVEADPVLSESDVYYVDPIDSSLVWSLEGVQVKVKFYNDEMLDAQYDPRYSPYTLTGWIHPELGYTPPLWTVFDITLINRTRDRVELDPTQAILRLDNGNFFYCRQKIGSVPRSGGRGPGDEGLWQDYPHFFDYSYLKWGSHAGRVNFHAQYDRNDIWRKSEYAREKPVRKGSKYSGKLTFPPLPRESKSFTLEINNFILAFDRYEVGYGNPLEWTDLAFHFNVDQGVKPMEKE